MLARSYVDHLDLMAPKLASISVVDEDAEVASHPDQCPRPVDVSKGRTSRHDETMTHLKCR
jgi:hypothetical protein